MSSPNSITTSEYLSGALEPNVQIVVCHMDACPGAHTLMRPVLDAQQSLPQLCQVERWRPAPTKGARGKSRTHGGGFLPGLEDSYSEMWSPSSAHGAAPRASCLFGCGGRTSSSSQERSELP